MLLAHLVREEDEDIFSWHRKDNLVFYHCQSTEGKTWPPRIHRVSLLIRSSSKWLRLFVLQNPKRFEEVFEEMICFLENTEHWENTEAELASRGVSHSSLDFYSLLQVLFVCCTTSCSVSPGKAPELLRHRPRLHPHGFLWGPGEPPHLHPERNQ